jgi:hypothetical protein
VVRRHIAGPGVALPTHPAGQVEGYGFSALQRDLATLGRHRLRRWGPAPPPLPPRSSPSGSDARSGAPSTPVPPGLGAGAWTPSPGGAAGSNTGGSGSWRGSSLRPSPGSGPGGFGAQAGSWFADELAAALGTAATEELLRAQGSGGAGGSAGRGGRGRGSGRGGGRGDGGGAQLAGRVDTSDVEARHPLRLRSAYATLDPDGCEPLWTTLHARYVGCVDFVWFTAGSAEASLRAGGGPEEEESAAALPTIADGAADGDVGFALRPMRTLLPPDPALFARGLPDASWPSDHMSLGVDFRLSSG